MCERKGKARVKLADGKERPIQHMMCTTFWHPDGTPMTRAAVHGEAVRRAAGVLQDEAELRALWSQPETRKKLLPGLAEKGFGAEQLAEMQKIIDAEKSDLFDVLAYVAYALPPDDARGARRARQGRDQHAVHRQAAGVPRLRARALRERRRRRSSTPRSSTPLLRLRYHDSIADALADLGDAEADRRVFAGFQKYLYQPSAA